MHAQAIAASFDSPAGFAAVMKGMFADGRAKESHAIWAAAQHKGVYDAVELRFATHESLGYAVIAFSVDGPVDTATRESLVARAERVPLRTIRYAALPYSSLMPLGRHRDHVVEGLTGPHPGVFVFVTTTKPKGPDRPYVAHCVADGEHYAFPIPGDRLRRHGARCR